MNNHDSEWSVLKTHSNRFSLTVDKSSIRFEKSLLLSMDMENSKYVTISTRQDGELLLIKFTLHQDFTPDTSPLHIRQRIAEIDCDALYHLLRDLTKQSCEEYVLQILELAKNEIICKFKLSEGIYE